MLKIFVMAIIFSVEIFTSVVLAKPRVTVVETGASDWSRLAAEFVEQYLFDSGKFTLIMNDEELADFKKNFPEYASVKSPGADYIVISRLDVEPAGRADKFKITHRVDFERNGVVIWSGEADKNFSAKKAAPKDWSDAVYKLTDKVAKKFFKAIDSGKIVLKE